jgi:hypothetical protein
MRSIVGNFFLRAAGRSCQLEMLDLARRHWPEAIGNRRRAFELVAFGWMMWRDPEVAERWLLLPLPADSRGGDAAVAANHGASGAPPAPGGGSDGRRPAGLLSREWAEYRRVFGNSRIREALRTLDERFPAIYDAMAARTHPSIKSLANAQTRPPSTKTGRLDRVGLFDGSRYARDGLLSSLRTEWLLDCLRGHVLLLEAFAAQAFAPTEWAKSRHEAAAVLDALRARIVRDHKDYAPHEQALERRRAAVRRRHEARRDLSREPRP